MAKLFDRFRAYNFDGEVVAEGTGNAKNEAVFDSGDNVVTRVVFYSGPVEEESVASAVYPNSPLSGPLIIDFPKV